MINLCEKTFPGVAIVGSGYWGKNLVRIYHEIGSLKLICDKDESAILRLKNKYPKLDYAVAFSDVLSRDDIQVVVISTPAAMHYAMTKEALLAEKHVYVEKPLVFNVEEAVELINIAKQKKCVLMVGHLMQYHPAFTQLKSLIKNGELGRINYIYSNRLNLGKIRREENILWSFAPHDISMILSLAGEMPESVSATGGNYLQKEIADVTTTHLEFPSGLKSHIFVSWLHPFKEQKLIVVGDKKMAVFDDTKPWSDKLLVYPHLIEWQDNLPVPKKAEPERFNILESEPLKLECEHFLHCIGKGYEPITSGEEGLRVLIILDACQKSLDNDGIKINPKEKQAFEETKYVTDEKDYFVHNTAVADQGVQIGKGTKIWCFSHLLSGSEIGSDCNIGQNVMIGPEVKIGDRCKIQNNVSVYKGVTLEDGVFCGPSMVFTNVYNPRAEIPKMDQVRPTLVKMGTTIGANATVVCGNTLGQYCFIGAGAVVTKDVPDHALMIGNPAIRIGWACICGETLDDRLECDHCSRKYKKTKTGIEKN